MPDQYENPDVYPCTGSYTWTPAIPANFGGINPALGFQNLIIDRGAFRNYYVPKRGEPNIKVSTSNKSEGNLYSPVINATRPLSLNVAVKQANNNNLVVYGDKSKSLVDFEFIAFSSSRLSCVEITYDLSLLFSDAALNNYSLSDPAQQEARSAIVSGAVTNANITTFLTSLTPGAVKVIGINGDTEKEIGELNLTRIRTTQNESGLTTASTATSPEAGPTFATVRIKTANSTLDRNAYPVYNKIRLEINTDIIPVPSSIVLLVKKIMFFTADRVNFRTLGTSKQLPCNALGYSMYFNGKFYPTIGLAYLFTGNASLANLDVAGYFFWPQDNRLLGCNVHIKLFNPDYRTGSPGFAHSLNLHIFIVDFPILDPFFILPHFAVIIGPTGFTQQLLFYGNSSKLVKNNLTVGNMSSPDFKQNNGYVELAQDGAATGITRQIFPYKDYIDIAANDQFYYEADTKKGSDIYQNIYVEQDGAVTNSEVYSGSLPRTSYLEAIEAIANIPNNQRKTVKYGSYIAKTVPSVYELFTSSDPCLIFKLNSESIPTSTFQEPGFMGAAIRTFVADKAQLFDTKLAYRIYAVSRGGDMNPNSTEALKHTFKIIDGGTDKSYLESTTFDQTWNFTNVLVSGNIGTILQDIYAEQIINNAGSENTKPFNVFNNTVFDLYCAVYAFSVLNENFAAYDLSEYSSLDYPLVTFSIQNDFVLTLPIYYRKSYNSGGTIQAMRDFGNYGKYTPDTSEYVVVSTLYNGQIFNTELPYDAVLNDATGFNLLMTMIDGADVGDQNTSFFIQPTPNEISEYDFVLATDATSHARVAAGEWQIEFDLNASIDCDIKYEIDLISSSTGKMILRLLNTEFGTVSQKEDDQKEKPNKVSTAIQVPFFLPAGDNILLLRVYVKGADTPSAGQIVINSIKLLRGKNTLQYFAYTTKQPLAVSSNYYEDLPVQPNTFIGNCSQYILKFNPQSIPVIYNLADGLYIDGCIYSPTWVVDMPENMELDYRGVVNQSLFPTRASGIQPYQIFFRTGTSNPVITVDTNKHSSTNLFVTLTNKETNLSEYAVKQFITESFMRFFRYDTLATTPKSNYNLQELNLQNPVMAKSEELLVEGVSVESTNGLITPLLNMEAPGYYVAQPAPAGLMYPLDNSAAIRKFMSYCPIVVCEYHPIEKLVYTLGVTPLGNLIFSRLPAVGSAQPGMVIIVETNSVDSASNKAEFGAIGASVWPGVYSGQATNNYPGILLKGDKALFFYVFKKINGATGAVNNTIYCKIFDNGNFLPPIKIFSFEDYAKQIGLNGYVFPEISHLTVCQPQVEIPINSPLFYLAFTCSNKIFLLQGVFSGFVFIASVAILYGNLQSSAPDKNFVSAINALISSSIIYRMRYSITDAAIGLYDTNLQGTQRVGLIDYDGKYMGVQFIIGSQLAEIVFDKSYAIKGDLRIIGNI